MKQYLIKIYEDRGEKVEFLIVNETELFNFIQENVRKNDVNKKSFAVYVLGDCVLDLS